MVESVALPGFGVGERGARHRKRDGKVVEEEPDAAVDVPSAPRGASRVSLPSIRRGARISPASWLARAVPTAGEPTEQPLPPMVRRWP